MAAGRRMEGTTVVPDVRVDAVDVSVQGEVAAAAERVLAECGPVDILVNNAGP
eukprot:COSAG01_NODE_4092_length_5356_cov_137.323378_6_plen_53_part_00